MVLIIYYVTHSNKNEDDPDIRLFYDTLINCIDEMTVLANVEGNPISLEYDELLKKITIAQCC